MLGHRPSVTHHPWPHTDESVELPSFPFHTRALPLAECKQQMQACRVLLPPPQHLHTYHPHQHIVHAGARCPRRRLRGTQNCGKPIPAASFGWGQHNTDRASPIWEAWTRCWDKPRKDRIPFLREFTVWWRVARAYLRALTFQ